MDQFSLLIVDDEVNIAEGLAFLVGRLLPECKVIGMANDGEQGYQLALKKRPDMILTDIRMPQADGIEMIRRLKAAKSPARFIILSGYAEFEYAQNAIALGVEGYIIKPVEEAELCAVIRKVCSGLAAEKCKTRQIREYGLKDILENSGERPETIKLKLSALGFPLTAERYLCTVWETDGETDGEKQEQLNLHLKSVAKEMLAFCDAAMPVPFPKTMTALILIYAKSHEKTVNKTLIEVRQQVSALLSKEVNVGVGVRCHQAEGISQSFEEARCALNYKVVKGSGCIISYEEISHIQTNQTLVDAQDIKALEECMDSMDDPGCRQAVDRIFSKILQDGNVSLVDLQVLSLNLVLTGVRKMPFMQFQLNSYLGRNILSLESISRFQTIEQLKNWIINMLRSMNELMLRENLPKRRDLIEEIKQYINKNYNKDISLNDIADRFYINPYYLSQLFKKRTGETYQKYLTGIRMNRAKKLLTETDLKIYEISALVGYTDSNYFSRIFERNTGIKPIEYRVSKTGPGKERQEKGYE